MNLVNKNSVQAIAGNSTKNFGRFRPNKLAQDLFFTQTQKQKLKTKLMATTLEKGTKPFDGQKTGTSGLRKKTNVFMEENYLDNWVQSLFNVVQNEIQGKTIGLGGDGRFYNKEAAQKIIKLAAGNGLSKVIVGQHGYMATPAMSALIRRRQLYGGLIMSASHNPGGINEDWGIKFNYQSGEPAPEKITDKIYEQTTQIKTLKIADINDIDLSQVGTQKFGDFEVEVVDPVSDYLATLKEVFDFDQIKQLLARQDFNFTYDALHAITGIYATRIFGDELGAKPGSLKNCVPSEDFNKGHPDPNLTYARELVGTMFRDNGPNFGAASDGDGDRNMVLGNKFFITPSDSVAMIAANYQAIPYFKSGLKGVARSMPTSQALDKVAEKENLTHFEVPTGWKYFGNLMDAGKCSICGEESFGTGGDHVREKDGLWAVLAWLQILAAKNQTQQNGGKFFGVREIAFEHWNKYGRNFFSRYDYEGCETEGANKMVARIRDIISKSAPGKKYGPLVLEKADEYDYVDPIDGSEAKNQGLRFVFTDGSRIIFRLSGTGSSGATIRIYVERYTDNPKRYDQNAQYALGDVIRAAWDISRIQHFTGRSEPTVVT